VYVRQLSIASAECRRTGYTGSVILTTAMNRQELKFGDRAFSVAGPTIWNSLHESVRLAETFAGFKHNLKTYLFNISFNLVFITY